jgi:hypothetical protein
MKLKLNSFMLVCVLGLVCLLCSPLHGTAQTAVSTAPDAASKEDVKKLFDVMASRDQMRQMMKQIFAQMRTMNREEIKKRQPGVSQEDLTRADQQSEEFIKDFPIDEMLDDMIPVYQRHFTKSEIEALINFYSSPAGQKFLHEMPAVTAETMRTVYPRLQAQMDAAMKRAEEKRDPPKK